MERTGDVSLRLAPHAVVLRRGTGHLQVGVQPAVVVSSDYAPVLTRLVCSASESTLVTAAVDVGIPADGVSSLLDALDRAGLLRRDQEDPTTRAVVRVVGAGRLSRRTAALLAAAGVGHLLLSPAPGDDQDRTSLSAYAATLTARHPTLAVRVTRHWSKPDDVAVDLTVLATDGPEVDRLVTDSLVAHDAAHLLLRSSGDEVSVGPLVLPGLTSCVRCADLARRDADPHWPLVLAQLVSVRLEPAPSLLAWACAYATVQVLAHLGGRVPEAAGHTVELRATDHATRLRAWPPHAECGCRWLDRTEWGHG